MVKILVLFFNMMCIKEMMNKILEKLVYFLVVIFEIYYF